MIKPVLSRPCRQAYAWIFTPPYYGVPWLVWLYVITAICCYHHGGVFAGYLTGYDDPVRMTQVLDWINGHGWYDRRIMRVDPPDGFQTIWSRIVDIPIALVVIIAQQFVVQKTAALIAGVIVPMLELRILFEAARYFARPLLGKQSARLISLFLLFTSIVHYTPFSVSGFYPGEASHHPWYLILIVTLFGALARLVIGCRSRQPVYMSAFCIGVLLAVGIEGLPLLAGASALLAGIAWHFNRPELARRGMQAYAGGAIFGLLLVPLHQPPAHFFTISLAEPSILGPILIAAAAVFLGSSAFVVRRLPRYASLAALIITAGILGAGLLAAFPQMLDGAAAGLSAAERAMAYREHLEAQPLHHVTRNIWNLLSLFLPLGVALAAGFFATVRAKSPRRRALACLYLGFTLIGSGLAETFSRYVHHAMTFACGWLLWLWQFLLKYMPQNTAYTFKALAWFVALAPLPMLLLPAITGNVPILSQVLLFPAALQSVPEPCGLMNFSRYVNATYGKGKILLVPGLDSSRMLFATDLTIDFLNNYPSQDRFIDNETFFGTQLPDVAKEIAARHHVDLVAVCKIATHPLPPLKPGEAPMMFERLEAGRPPDWLKPVEIHLPGLYRLYEVDKAALNSTDKTQ